VSLARGQMEGARDEAIYASGAVVRMTGISAHALRAWERRYGAVRPARTPGGARRYSRRDVDRLRLLLRATRAGHPIGQVARLPDEEIMRRLEQAGPVRHDAAALLLHDDLMESIRALDVATVERSLGVQFAALGPRAFARDLLTPLFHRVGEAWEAGELSVAAEHAATAAARNVLGLALRRTGAERGAPVLFATPEGELHELGLLVAATWALGAGAHVVYLGASVPIPDLALAARRLGARAVALGISGTGDADTHAYLRELRRALPADVSVWLGGSGTTNLEAVPGVETLRAMEELERHVSRIY